MTISNGDIKVSGDWGNWFAGFADGEGCFVICKRNSSNLCATYRCQFQIGLRKDDGMVLEEIRDTLGLGTVHNKHVRSVGGCNGQLSTVFYVSAIADCAKLVEIFDRFPLRAKKKHDFAVWRCAVVELQKPFSDRNLELLNYYFHRIKQVRRYRESRAILKPVVVDTQLMIDF